MNVYPFFNAHHAPAGAYATATFGCKGSRGGFAAALKGPANHPIFVGLEESRRPGVYECLPFFEGGDVSNSDALDYDVEGMSDFQHQRSLFVFPDHQIHREFGPRCDIWSAGDLQLVVTTPIGPFPDPHTASVEDLMHSYVPSVSVELIVDNRNGKNPRKAFFGFSGHALNHSMRTIRENGITGIAQGHGVGIATNDPDSIAGIAFQPEAILNHTYQENLDFCLGGCGLLVVTVQPGERKSIPFTIGFYHHGPATTGTTTEYLYQRLFGSLEEVLEYSLEESATLTIGAKEFDERIRQQLGNIRAKTFAHTARSYVGNTQLLVTPNDEYYWVVNEGEYRLMNTFDLTADQLFYELAMNPWTVKSELDQFCDRYSYEDEVVFPNGKDAYPGGITFTHDMGVANHFSPLGRSAYEQCGLKGVFSFMCSEELVNWILCSCLYLTTTRDIEWLKSRHTMIARAIRSLVNRDHPNPSERNGVIGLDSTWCKGGAEITTYDSLDKSLGQARNNLYLAVKTCVAYALAEEHLRTAGDTFTADLAKQQSILCAQTIIKSADEDGLLPAVIGEGNNARIIPAIEGLVFPFVAGREDLIGGNGALADLRTVLETHLKKVLVKGICKFEDGSWKLSSSSRNSWLSKIYLSQYVAEQVLGLPQDTNADQIHWEWLMDEDNSYFAWSDQMVEGKAHGSRYYPRGVTSVLWLAKGNAPLQAITSLIQSIHKPQTAVY